MSRTPYEVLNEHRVDPTAHDLDDRWSRIEDIFRTQERVSKKNADAIAALTKRFERCCMAIDTLANKSLSVELPSSLFEAHKKNAKDTDDQPIAEESQRIDWQHKAGEQILTLLQNIGLLPGLVSGITKRGDVASLIAREIIDVEGTALGLRNMHDRAALRSLRGEVQALCQHEAENWGDLSQASAGKVSAFVHVLALIDARLAEGNQQASPVS